MNKPEEIKQPSVNAQPVPIIERPSSRPTRHPPPVAVKTVAGVKTDFTVVKSKPVKTKLVIQRNLGDVTFNPKILMREKQKRMKEYIRLRQIERGEFSFFLFYLI